MKAELVFFDKINKYKLDLLIDKIKSSLNLIIRERLGKMRIENSDNIVFRNIHY